MIWQKVSATEHGLGKEQAGKKRQHRDESDAVGSEQAKRSRGSLLALCLSNSSRESLLKMYESDDLSMQLHSEGVGAQGSNVMAATSEIQQGVENTHTHTLHRDTRKLYVRHTHKHTHTHTCIGLCICLYNNFTTNTTANR
jgi:hypothetical protein